MAVVKYDLPKIPMRFFEINSEEILKPQNWTFPIPISYGPGRLTEIAHFCQSLEINNPLIVTDSNSKELPFFMHLMKKLNAKQINCPKPILNKKRKFLFKVEKKLASITSETTSDQD